jgi:hypothetical protein
VTLESSGLAGDLEKLFTGTDGYPASDDEAGQRWAKIYRAYASSAVAGPTAPSDTSLRDAAARLARALAAAFTTAKAPDAGIATLTPLMDAAFVAFWLGRPPEVPAVAFASPPPPDPPAPPPPTFTGVVISATTGVLSPGLSEVLTAPDARSATAAQQARSIATVLHDWTRNEVLVVNTPMIPPGPTNDPVGLT